VLEAWAPHLEACSLVFVSCPKTMRCLGRAGWCLDCCIASVIMCRQERPDLQRTDRTSCPYARSCIIVGSWGSDHIHWSFLYVIAACWTLVWPR
jgi:hypothetical protein